MITRFGPRLAGMLMAGAAMLGAMAPAAAAQRFDGDSVRAPASVVRLAQSDAYRPPQGYGDERYGRGGAGGYNPGGAGDVYRPPSNSARGDDAYRPSGGSYGSGSTYNSGGSGDAYRPSGGGGSYGGGYDDRGVPPSNGYGEPYAPPREEALRRDGGRDYYEDRGPRKLDEYDERSTYSKNEIVEAGHGFFGSISKGLANVIEYAFQKAGRPNGYILGEDAGGAFVAGLRYGEGRLHTKNAGSLKVYWQGPSVGYDFGGAGSKTMVLVYNLRDTSDVFRRFGGVEGTAYLVGGVSIQFLKHGDVTMAPIRAGVGLRLGANIGYLKYTRSPTWNPF
jgi:hypothetical protein